MLNKIKNRYIGGSWDRNECVRKLKKDS